MLNLQRMVSAWNRYRKEKFPSRFVRRTKYDHLREKYDTLTAAIASPLNALLRQASIHAVKPFQQKTPHSEVCVFVSYSPVPCIKPHVQHHIQALIAAGIEVVLVLNTDAHDAPLASPDPVLWSALSGVYVRENIGFDFSAWSHVYALTKNQMQTQRLYWVNDSVIGPLSDDMLAVLLARVRASSAALVGLTKNEKPRYHVQSYFLVLNAPLLEHPAFANYLACLWALPSKEMVIDTYETHLTQAVVDMGFGVDALFAQVGMPGDKTDNVLHHIDALVDLGFPYIKASVSQAPQAQRLLQQWLPDLTQS